MTDVPGLTEEMQQRLAQLATKQRARTFTDEEYIQECYITIWKALCHNSNIPLRAAANTGPKYGYLASKFAAIKVVSDLHPRQGLLAVQIPRIARIAAGFTPETPEGGTE